MEGESKAEKEDDHPHDGPGPLQEIPHCAPEIIGIRRTHRSHAVTTVVYE